MVRLIKKIFLSIILLFSCFGAFSLDTQIDVLAGGFYNNTNVFTGSANYQKIINYDPVDIKGDFRAVFNAAGGSLGFDLFFNPYPFGVYFRAGFLSVGNVERTAGGEKVSLKNTDLTFNMFYDIGGVYSFNIINYFSVCAAPAASFLFLTSEYKNLNNLYSARATLDSVLSFGLSADLYAKFRYKYFVAAAGCAFSFYPLTLVTSSDSKINYSTNITDTMAFNIRPYISIGFTFRERTASNIMPEN